MDQSSYFHVSTSVHIFVLHPEDMHLIFGSESRQLFTQASREYNYFLPSQGISGDSVRRGVVAVNAPKVKFAVKRQSRRRRKRFTTTTIAFYFSTPFHTAMANFRNSNNAIIRSDVPHQSSSNKVTATPRPIGGGGKGKSNPIQRPSSGIGGKGLGQKTLRRHR